VRAVKTAQSCPIRREFVICLFMKLSLAPKALPSTILALLLFAISFASSLAFAQISLPEFNQVSQAFRAEWSAELSAQKSELYINRPPSPQVPNYWWDLDYTHASYSTYTRPETGIREHNIFLFGGYARIPGMTQDTVIATLCHELGHGIGGEPLKQKKDLEPISTEGQSDFYAYRFCLERMFKRIPPQAPVVAVSSYVERLCRLQSASSESLEFCYRGFQTLEIERMLFKQSQNVETAYDTPDLSVVSEVNHSETYYPSAQCRIDTMIAGLLKQERPRCWWAPSGDSPTSLEPLP
jgi:hypothetical protein